jgi:hypothetical protein
LRSGISIRAAGAEGLPFRTVLAYAAAAFMVVAGAATAWRDRGVGRCGACHLLHHYCRHPDERPRGARPLREFGAYSGIAYQLAVAAGALIIYASAAQIDAALAARLKRVGLLSSEFARCSSVVRISCT